MNTHTGEEACSYSQGTEGSESFEHRSPQANNGDSESPGELCLGPNSEEADAKNNMKLLENAKKPYTCSICNKSFAYNYTMIIHMRTHTIEKPFKCILCSKPFSYKKNITRHMRIHTGEKPFSCMICSKQFVQNSEVKSHMRIHTSEKPFSCMICSKRFAHKYHAKSHMQTHTGEKLYSCSHCNKSYASKRFFKRHVRNHTNEISYSVSLNKGKEDESYRVSPKEQCLVPNCEDNVVPDNKAESREKSDKGAESSNCKVESIEKLYICSLCNKSFKHNDSLKVHMRIHTIK